jgi:hypothetical protein
VPPDARAGLAGTRLVDDQRSTLKGLIVEAAYGLLRLGGIGEFDKGNPARPPALPIRREMDEYQGTDGREMLPQLGFSGLIRQIPYK